MSQSTAVNNGGRNGDKNLHLNIERVDNIYKEIFDIDNLIRAYEFLKSRPASMTPGSDNPTIDRFSIEKLKRISEELKTEKYKPKPVRRILIPKTNGKTRPLGIPSIEDRIVQVAMKVQIEKIFENKFLPSSHGYRPGKSCHSALRQMNQ
jgi:retron-type reverse transcriptase